MKVSKVYLWLCIAAMFSQVGFSKTFFKEERMLFHVTRNEFDKAKRMMDKGANINARDSQLMTPFFHSAAVGDIKTMNLLYNISNADIMIPTDKEMNSLMVICERGHIDAFKWLINVYSVYNII